MPKKASTATRPAQTRAESGPLKPRGLRTSSFARRAAVTTQIQGTGDREMADNDEESGGDAEDENMVEMLAMLQEFQKRKATKTSARCAAFQTQKAAMFNEARKKVDDVVRNGAASIEKARATVLELRSQEVSPEAILISLRSLWESQHECVQGLSSSYNAIIEDLAHRRAEQIDEASAMLESQALEREASRKRLLTQARTCIEENIEHQKVATDANKLIKHYKALLRP
ncbi:hypothetical protein BD414DRAFT_536147 [Trametes punicea]|nr:hypothetical protein BD414DRAFT_536147 [Trametes punicea]